MTLGKFIGMASAALALFFVITVVLPFTWNVSELTKNPSPENTQKVAEEGSKVIVEAAIPWWLPLLEWGAPGIVIFLVIAIVAPKLLRA